MNFFSNRLLFSVKTLGRQTLLFKGHSQRLKSTTSKLKKLIEVIPKDRINDCDGRGWTALMLAARDGDVDALELLIEKGAKANIITPSGHSAYDIAVFWRQHESAKLLKPLEMSVQVDNYFSFDGIDRKAIRRGNADWIQKAVIQDTTEFVLLYNTKPLICYEGKPSPKTKMHMIPDLFITSYADVHHLIPDSLNNVIYLGQWAPGDANLRKKGEKLVERNIFALDVSELSSDDLAELFPSVEVLPVYPGLLRLHPDHACIAAHARSLLDWHHRYQFCSTCGSKTTMTHAGYKRSCTNKSCSTNTEEKSNTCYPRVDPTVISAIVSRDNCYSLLARQKGFPPGMYSCLAGFVEPGESVEQACRREIQEEVGLLVKQVTYHSSQPWPMPSSLMLGCTAYTDYIPNIEINSDELEDARWFTRSDVVLMIMQHHPEGLLLPPKQAIAHRLLNDWLVKTAFAT